MVYDIKANEIITLEFNITVNCINNFTNLDILNPIQDAQIFIQFRDELMDYVYKTAHSTLDEADLEPINAVSNKAIEAWNYLIRYKYLNLLIQVPLKYNATFYV